MILISSHQSLIKASAILAGYVASNKSLHLSVPPSPDLRRGGARLPGLLGECSKEAMQTYGVLPTSLASGGTRAS